MARKASRCRYLDLRAASCNGLGPFQSAELAILIIEIETKPQVRAFLIKEAMLTQMPAARPNKVATWCVPSGRMAVVGLLCDSASRNALVREKKAKNVASKMDFGFGG